MTTATVEITFKKLKHARAFMEGLDEGAEYAIPYRYIAINRDGSPKVFMSTEAALCNEDWIKKIPSLRKVYVVDEVPQGVYRLTMYTPKFNLFDWFLWMVWATRPPGAEVSYKPLNRRRRR